VHAYNPSTREAKTRELKVPGQPWLHSDILSQKNKNNNSNNNINIIFREDEEILSFPIAPYISSL
jgi:hypothetical protein